MAEVQKVRTHGKPPPGTKIRYLTGYNGVTIGLSGGVGYVAELSTPEPDYIGFSEDKNAIHDAEWICHSWELVDDNESELTDEQKQAVTDLLLRKAGERGMVITMQAILNDLGFPTTPKPKTQKVTVEFEVEVKDGFSFHPINLEYNDLNAKQGNPVVEILSAKVVED